MALSDAIDTSDALLQRRLQELELRVQHQAREIRALEKIEGLLERGRALETANRHLQAKVEELQTCWSLSRTLGATLNPEELYRLALHLIGRSLQVDAYALFLLDEPARRLTRQAAFGLPDAPGPGGALPLDAGPVGRVAASGRPCHLPDVRTDPSVAQAGFPGQGALLAVPLRLPGGRVLGVLAAHKPGPAAFTPNDRELFEAVATQVAVALENAQLYQRTKELSARDELTRLFNRRAFFENLESEVQRARRYRRTFGVLMLDLDHFKHYNDTHGHLRGDEVLRELGRLLLGTTRRADVVARFGGEEFVILLPEVSKAGGAIVAEKIRAAVATAPFYGREQQPGGALTATLGLAAYPGDAEDGLELVDRADRALYTGKQLGGNRVALAAGQDAPPPAAA